MVVRPFKVNKEMFLPMFGVPHIDGPEVDQNEVTYGNYHFHTDFRFMTLEEIDCMSSQSSSLIKFEGRSLRADDVEDRDFYIQLTWFPRIYARKWGGLIHPSLALEEKFSRCRLPPGAKICPHQGFDLTTIEPVEIDGKMRIICPGHSLNWDADTGKHVPQKRFRVCES
jgi:hypothetical protein